MSKPEGEFLEHSLANVTVLTNGIHTHTHRELEMKGRFGEGEGRMEGEEPNRLQLNHMPLRLYETLCAEVKKTHEQKQEQMKWLKPSVATVFGKEDEDGQKG